MNDTLVERQRGKRAAGFFPAEASPAARRERPSRRGWGGLVLLALLAGLLAVCHGCHGDVDDELFSLGWWVSAGK